MASSNSTKHNTTIFSAAKIPYRNNDQDVQLRLLCMQGTMLVRQRRGGLRCTLDCFLQEKVHNASTDSFHYSLPYLDSECQKKQP